MRINIGREDEECLRSLGVAFTMVSFDLPLHLSRNWLLVLLVTPPCNDLVSIMRLGVS
jgi:hypothetical protein